ncbi:SdpI family protein [Kaistella polysaccharea]|uniref:SdpI family protein n=1 Tax=Kaistella polysaccharea TaxID=2878534 RepID=UPI001CF4544C|nr:SdpI family protein [Kaistella polysaccharea]
MYDQLVENPLFNITFFGGLIFMLAGFIQFQFPPKKINSLYGYRTNSSMKNQERWDFSQKFSAKELMKLGGLLAGSSLLALITNFNDSINLIIGLFLMVAMVIILFFRVEKAVKTKFRN